MTLKKEVKVEFYIFIVLIHPIQWTIALLIGMIDPTKQQKKAILYIIHARPSWSVHSLGGASYCLPV